MKIIGYKNASNIPEKYYTSLIEKEIECWGLEPFSEYMICENCMGIYSIQKVYGDINNYKNNTKINTFKCNCGTVTKLLYPKNKFLTLFKEYIKGQVSGVLLIEKEKVEGFGFLSKTTIGELLYNEFNTRPNSYSKKDILDTLSSLLGTINTKDISVVCMNHIYISENLRAGNNAYKISENIFLNNKEYSLLPVFLKLDMILIFTQYDKVCDLKL